MDSSERLVVTLKGSAKGCVWLCSLNSIIGYQDVRSYCEKGQEYPTVNVDVAHWHLCCRVSIKPRLAWPPYVSVNAKTIEQVA